MLVDLTKTYSTKDALHTTRPTVGGYPMQVSNQYFFF
jgi:hypothetical protein